ncbi:MAG: hypothetical protein ACYS0E_01865 [Planctomycetota bacterium]|jgi:hypothetical protein
MGRQTIFAILWLATVAIAFFAGAQIGDPATRSNAPQRSAERSPDYNVSGGAQPKSSEVASQQATKGQAKLREPDVYVEEKLVLEEIETVQELSDLLMAYTRRKLNQGPEGHKELFKAMNELLERKDLRKILRDERQLMPLAYPWLRFAFEHERQIIDMMETLYKTAAQHPEWFEGLDDNPFEAFTEGLAVLLPGAVNEERLEKFRGYVRVILAADPETQPKAVQRNRRDFQNNLEIWGKPLSQEQMVAILQDPSESDVDKLSLLRRMTPAQLRGVDATAIVARELERGNLNATRALRGVELSGGDRVSLDRAFVEGIQKSRNRWWAVRNYVQATGRDKWVDIKPLIEEGLRRGGDATTKFAHSMVWLPELPPAEYVRTVIESYELPDATIQQLKQKYKIE